MLKERVSLSVEKIGMKRLQNPIFYNSPIGIRFEISEPWGEVYCDDKLNPKYVQATYEKVFTIYQNMMCKFDTLLWTIYPNEYNGNSIDLLNNFMQITELSLPQEKYSEMNYLEDDSDGQVEKISYYWDLRTNFININKLLEEIIKADLGGFEALVSSIFLFDTKLNVLFHFYDDRGLDIVSEKRETIYSLYKNYNEWILDYDREHINAVFTKK